VNRRLLGCTLAAAVLATVLAACSTPSPEAPGPAQQQPVAPLAAARPVSPAYAPAPVSNTIESYKHAFATRVATSSPSVFHEPLPKMLKSVVVVDVTIHRDGRVASASIRRSNGYKDLEKVALQSVHHAAPYAAPSRALLRSDGTVNFLETFLFRDDGRFQVRTLAEAQ
jgi:periplasmic protein TonB